MLTPHFFFGEQTHMSLGQKISRAILQWPVSGLVNHKSLPENPITELKLDPARPIVYALKTSSITDLMTLQQCCEDLGLPGPFTPLELNGQLLPRYVCLDRPPPCSARATSRSPSCRSSTSCWTCTSRIRRWTSR